jgi:hypothetical protein
MMERRNDELESAKKRLSFLDDAPTDAKKPDKYQENISRWKNMSTNLVLLKIA